MHYFGLPLQVEEFFEKLTIYESPYTFAIATCGVDQSLMWLGDNNNNHVFQTLDRALEANPSAQPLFHSDRGFHYTNKNLRTKIEQAGMTQSMSRVAHYLDNGPMEDFWGILKLEMYYRRKFRSRQELVQAIEDYINYYTYERPQRRLGILTPSEFHEHLSLMAWKTAHMIVSRIILTFFHCLLDGEHTKITYTAAPLPIALGLKVPKRGG